MILLAQKNTLFTNRFFGAAWSFVSFRSLRRGCLYFGVLSSFPAFLLSGFPAFLISCFPAFLLFCFPSLRFSCFPAFTFFDVYTRLCKALCPHPGEMVYLAYLKFLLFFTFFMLSCFPACLLSCFSTFLLVCFAVLLLQFVSAFVFTWLCFAVLVLLSFLCRVVLHIMLTLSCSVCVQFSPYQPAVVQRRSGSSMASLDKASAAWLYSR